MQVGTYPTRNFACFSSPFTGIWLAHNGFNLVLHVAMQPPLYLCWLLILISTWRIVCEDFLMFPLRSFLLIDSTEQIFTLSELLWVERVLSDTELFQHIVKFSFYAVYTIKRRIHASLWQLAFHHRTVIVTAAVHRGFICSLTALRANNNVIHGHIIVILGNTLFNKLCMTRSKWQSMTTVWLLSVCSTGQPRI